MSKCTHCFQGICRKHPSQDHGEREALIKTKAQGPSKDHITDLLKAQIQKLQEQSKGTSNDDIYEYRNKLDQDRMQQMKLSSSSSKKPNPLLSNTGLNPTVASLMSRHYDSDSESDSDDSYSRRKRKRKEEKESKKKHKKDSKKDSKKSKKSKKEKKKSSKKEKKEKRENDSDSDESTSSSSSSSS